ncbi:MAG TPA: haloacid dehalogenase type II [Candidatus Saccharimonadales bacterium]|nr:haloacid dehalogenase type II [Candidatus Saccharimonadales bacterium]
MSTSAEFRVEVVMFDVVETLFSLEAVGARLTAAGAGDRALELWFTRFLRDGFALAASGTYKPFPEVAVSSLTSVLRASGIEPNERLVAHILEALSELEPYPDARPALEYLFDRGVRAMTLTNGAAAATQGLLERAGLRTLVEATLTVEQTKAWKPRPEPYLAACRAAGVAPVRAALVAVHAWDIHGAATAGLQTGWCSRLEGHFPAVFDRPSVRGETLVDVVKQLA